MKPAVSQTLALRSMPYDDDGRLRTWIGACLLAVLLVFGVFADAAEAPEMSGRELYRQFCASCHGGRAQGDGPVAASLKQRPADLTRIAFRNGGKFPVERVRATIVGSDLSAVHGTRDMPVWGWEFYAYKGEDPARRKRVDELVSRLVDYLRSIQDKKSN